MHLVVSGEGNTDIGKNVRGIGSYIENIFVPAPMYYLIDKIIEKKLDYSIYDLMPEQIMFIPKGKLMDECKSIRFLTGKKKGQETGLFYKNARGLARITKKECIRRNDNDSMSILFRDSDGTRSIESTYHDKKVESIENAFEIEGIKGVAMIPRPKSESWLICALKKTPYQSCNSLEKRSGNDDSPNNLKDELIDILEKRNIEYNDINLMIKDGSIDIDKIEMDSFVYFKNKLEELL